MGILASLTVDQRRRFAQKRRRKLVVSGVYKITCKVTGKVYIGSSVDIITRCGDHRKRLRHGTHRNINLLRAWQKYGEPDFEFRILEQVEPARLVEREHYWMDALKSCDPEAGYNIHRASRAR